MDSIQKAALVALVVVGAAVSIYVVHVINSESARLEANEEYYYMCKDWRNNIENSRAELDAREDSLGGMLDLDGDVASFRNQFNLEVDRYNAECAT